MMKKIIGLFIILLFSSLVNSALAKNKWPKEIPLKNNGKITVYQPQCESLENNILKTRAAISIKKTDKSEPVFGVIWSDAQLETDRSTRMATLVNIKITDARFPDETRESLIDSLKNFLAKEVMKWNLEVSLDEITNTLEQNKAAADEKLNTAPPKIIYMDKPSMLLVYDGEPIVKKDEKLKMDRAVNTPLLVVKSSEDGKYYMYGQKIWYSSASLKENWAPTKSLPATIKVVNEQIVKYEKENNDTTKAPSPTPVVVVCTEPTELIQSNGEPKFAAVENAGLLYMTNTDDDIFMDVAGKQYHILLSGRWYSSPALNGPWTYVSSDKLPSDFAKIPENSEKGSVLANVAGTDASKEAVMDAQIPQTAKVDRKTVTTTVTYDGEPKFENIQGTKIDLAVNTSSTVMRSNGKYYAVENGVWFVSPNATGPWTVSDQRPTDVDSIPATSPAYNTKYVYIYDSTPDVVYVGYTPGYMGCYVYGPTVVYGTGYYYYPWYGAYYYPRPVTYGFGFHYNPYTGWGMTVGVNFGMVSVSFGGYGYHYGPHYHYPPYRPPYYGHHPHHPAHYGGGYYGNRNGGNIYRGQNGVATRPSTRPSGGGQGNKPSTLPSNRPGNGGVGGNKPSTLPSNNPGGGAGNRPSTQPTRPGAAEGVGGGKSPSTMPASKGANNVYSDKQGNVYKQNDKGGWDQRSNGNWNSTSPSKNQNVNQMQRDSQMRDRSNSRQNYSPSSRPSGGGGGGMRSGGGSRGGGGRR